MLPDNPLLAIYVLGVYGFLTVPLFVWFVARERFEVLVSRGVKTGIPGGRAGFLLFLLLAYSIGWPIAVFAFLYLRRRGGL